MHPLSDQHLCVFYMCSRKQWSWFGTWTPFHVFCCSSRWWASALPQPLHRTDDAAAVTTPSAAAICLKDAAVWHVAMVDASIKTNRTGIGRLEASPLSSLPAATMTSDVPLPVVKDPLMEGRTHAGQYVCGLVMISAATLTSLSSRL